MKKVSISLAGALLVLAACKKDSTSTTPQSTDFPTTTLTPAVSTIRVAGLPAPYATTVATNYPQVLMKRPAGATLQVPAGYVVNIFREGVKNGRGLAIAPNGDVFVAQGNSNQIMVLRANSTGAADSVGVWASEGLLDRPMGMAFQGNYLYVACSGAVYRYDYTSGQTKASGAPTKLVTIPEGGQHAYRTLLILNNKMYVPIGSSQNVVVEQDTRATVQEFNLDGSGGVTYASGTRSPLGIDVNPARPGEIWQAVNERDELGDGLVPDYATVLPRGSFFGYPWVYLAPTNRDPRITGPVPAQVANTRTPEVLFEPHSAAIGLAFYKGTMFPADARGDLFIAMHGSWNRSVGTGYKVVRIRMDKTTGAPATAGPDGRGASYEDFVTGWQLNPGQVGTPQVWGRPVGVITAADGSLLIADDGAGVVWRVSYRG